MSCETEEQNKDAAYDAYAAAQDIHIAACNASPRDEELIISTGLAAGELFGVFVDARAAWLDCLASASSSSSSEGGM